MIEFRRMKLGVIAISILFCSCSLKGPNSPAANPVTKSSCEGSRVKKLKVQKIRRVPSASIRNEPSGEVLKSGDEEERLRDEKLKAYLEDPHGLKAYGRLMEQLKADSKPPFKNSQFIGKWNGNRGEKKHYYLFKGDGTFTFDFGHSTGSGKWKQVSAARIAICYDHWREGKDFIAHKFADIDGEVLSVDQFDYSND